MAFPVTKASPWEITGCFLDDLNANEWDNPLLVRINITPIGFPRERLLKRRLLDLNYRYNFTTTHWPTWTTLFWRSVNCLPKRYIDGYSDGPLQTTLIRMRISWTTIPLCCGPVARTHQPLFRPSDIVRPEQDGTERDTAGFIELLEHAGTNVSTYDRYTFYPVLSATRHGYLRRTRAI